MGSRFPPRGVVTLGQCLAAVSLHQWRATPRSPSSEAATDSEHTGVRSHLRSLLPMHITLCLLELNFICLQVAQSPKMFKRIWSFLQTSFVFISPNNLEVVEVSGKRLSGDYARRAPGTSDQAAGGGSRGARRRVLPSALAPHLRALEGRQGACPGLWGSSCKGTVV